jgi:hypothetical protein
VSFDFMSRLRRGSAQGGAPEDDVADLAYLAEATDTPPDGYAEAVEAQRQYLLARGLVENVDFSIGERGQVAAPESPTQGPTVDTDGDGIPDLADNCPTLANADQLDGNGDGIGNVCPLRPVLECVDDLGAGRYRAHFGYKNEETVTRVLNIGAYNRFSPAPNFQGQATVFLAGRQVDVFTVEFTASNLVWNLGGRTSTASAGSKRCAP